jgi:hypothetical protein
MVEDLAQEELEAQLVTLEEMEGLEEAHREAKHREREILRQHPRHKEIMQVLLKLICPMLVLVVVVVLVL